MVARPLLHLPVNDHATVEQLEMGEGNLGCLPGVHWKRQHKNLVGGKKGVEIHQDSGHRMDLKYCELILKVAIYVLLCTNFNANYHQLRRLQHPLHS